MSRLFHLEPTSEDTFTIVYPGHSDPLSEAIGESWRQEASGDIEGACNTRYRAFQTLIESLPEEDPIVLEWGSPTNQNALMLISLSAIDHFLAGDFEMCAGMLELMLDLDPEDHLEATRRLAYAYLALEEYELYDEVIDDISDKYPDKSILRLWNEYRRTGQVSTGEMVHFKKVFTPYYKEFTANDHPVDEAYAAGLKSEKPSQDVLARELYLQTEHLWKLFPGFIEVISQPAES